MMSTSTAPALTAQSVRVDLYAPGTPEAWRYFAAALVIFVLPTPSPTDFPDGEEDDDEEEDDWWVFELISEDLRRVIRGHMHITEPDVDKDTFHLVITEVLSSEPLKPPSEVVAESNRLGGLEAFLLRLKASWPVPEPLVRYDVSYKIDRSAWPMTKLPAMGTAQIKIQGGEYRAVPAVQGWRFTPDIDGLTVVTITGTGVGDDEYNLRCGGIWSGPITNDLFETVRTSCSSAVQKLTTS